MYENSELTALPCISDIPHRIPKSAHSRFHSRALQRPPPDLSLRQVPTTCPAYLIITYTAPLCTNTAGVGNTLITPQYVNPNERYQMPAPFGRPGLVLTTAGYIAAVIGRSAEGIKLQVFGRIAHRIRCLRLIWSRVVRLRWVSPFSLWCETFWTCGIGETVGW